MKSVLCKMSNLSEVMKHATSKCYLKVEDTRGEIPNMNLILNTEAQDYFH